MPLSRFPLSPAATLSQRTIGHEGEHLLMLDGVLQHPEALVAEAASSAFDPAWGPDGGYPGVRAPAPLDYVETVSRGLLPILVELFGLGDARLARAECNFSLVTLQPCALHPSQREPHVDTDDRWQYAILHYLCGAELGGTGFYRHRATGFETIRPERMAAYADARAVECAELEGYPGQSLRFFEQIDQVDAAFNRLVVYRSRLLHSGLILRPDLLSADPARGRLTANIFLTLRPGDLNRPAPKP